MENQKEIYISIFNEIYFNDSSILAFFFGLLFGLSLVFNLTYLLKRRFHEETGANHPAYRYATYRGEL